MPIAPRRRHEIAVAVVTYDSANQSLPRSAARLLAMFPVEDLCQRSLDDIATREDSTGRALLRP
jgi:hypothetical protein